MSRLLRFAALGCLVVSLLDAVAGVTALGAGYVPWMLGGFVAWVAAAVVG